MHGSGGFSSHALRFTFHVLRFTHHVSRITFHAILALSLASCLRLGARPPAVPWQPSEFLIGLRSPPPAKAEAYALAAQAGFTTIVDSVGPDALGLARHNGLKLMVGKIGLDTATCSRAEGRRRTADQVERFRGHPALWGYFLGQEAREADFEALGRLADFVREHGQDKPFFLSLLPSDAFVGPALADADYVDYVERFLRAVRPPLLAWAGLPLRAGAPEGGYFENLEIIRRAALAHGIPFCAPLRGAVWPGMAPLGEGDLRWQVYTSLAYGARGVAWFSYWGAPDGGREGIVAPDGSPTERYRWVAALNAELRTLGPTLLRLRSTAVYHTGDVPPGATRLPAHGLVGSVEGGSFVVGLFDGDGCCVLLASKDRQRDVTARMTIQRPCRSAVWLDPATGRWLDLPVRTDRFRTAIEFPLPPGGGRLLRLGLMP